MENIPKRIPDPCPDHPDALTFRTVERSADGNTLRQHYCAVPGCQEGLGWYFHEIRKPNSVQYGPGLCDNPDVLHKITSAEYDSVSLFIIGILLAIAIMSGATAALFYQHHMTTPATAATITSAVTGCLVLLTTVLWRVYRPTREQFEHAGVTEQD